jgi:hypothetical protein
MNYHRKKGRWQPLDEDSLNAIDDLFAEIFPASEYGNLAEEIGDYWIERLETVWANKSEQVKNKDLGFNPNDPLSRIFRHTVVIAYPDSVCHDNEATLETLERFLDHHFPSVKGLHLLPACRIAADRFNDGYFSQIQRNVIQEGFGTNAMFSHMMEKYFSMADFVLNHVDIDNPNFKEFLAGKDDAARCFYVFSEKEYRERHVAGAFQNIFRPRPFPLFTIFRRSPADELFEAMDFEQKCIAINEILEPDAIDLETIKILSLFEMIKNDQGLLDFDYAHIAGFRQYLQARGIDPDALFCLSMTQESVNPPLIFKENIASRADLLRGIGYNADDARRIAEKYEYFDEAVFGEQVRAMTTFSHVQVDINTSTFEGLKMIADDFSWYLGLDINMLRLDAANYAFKKFHTSCFGLPEVKKLMQILFLSMDCVSPRIVANLEVNDRLGFILAQMADKDAPPPMIYDFHLPCILPVVFNTGNTRILDRIFELIDKYDIPRESIRFSLAESHDGKSVRGSMDILHFSERWLLSEIVKQNNGRIKYKAVLPGRFDPEEFREICRQAGIDHDHAAGMLFESPKPPNSELELKKGIQTTDQIFAALDMQSDGPTAESAILFFADKVLNGREPYELCCSTRDSLIRLNDETLEAARFLAFYTLAFSLMGRNVKSIYFNDMMGLPNDLRRMEKTGEYRDIKRTRSRYTQLVEKIETVDEINHIIARGIALLVNMVDNDMALHPRGNEAETIFSGNPAVAIVHNHYRENQSLTIVNTRNASQDINADLSAIPANPASLDLFNWVDSITNKSYRLDNGQLSITLDPYERLWLKPGNA